MRYTRCIDWSDLGNESGGPRSRPSRRSCVPGWRRATPSACARRSRTWGSRPTAVRAPEASSRAGFCLKSVFLRSTGRTRCSGRLARRARDGGRANSKVIAAPIDYALDVHVWWPSACWMRSARPHRSCRLGPVLLVQSVLLAEAVETRPSIASARGSRCWPGCEGCEHVGLRRDRRCRGQDQGAHRCCSRTRSTRGGTSGCPGRCRSGSPSSSTATGLPTRSSGLALGTFLRLPSTFVMQ